MKLKATFECAEHQDYGTLGWRMVTQPNFDPLTDMALPHDMMEHRARDTGTVEEELQALGASLHVRNMEQFYVDMGQANPDPAVNIASDFPTLFNQYLAGRELNTPPKTVPIDDVEEVIDRVFIECANFVKWNEMDALTEDQKTSIRGWVRLGYRRAQKRYANIDPYILCRAFAVAAAEANKWELIPGIKMALHIEVNTGGYHVTSEERS